MDHAMCETSKTYVLQILTHKNFKILSLQIEINNIHNR